MNETNATYIAIIVLSLLAIVFGPFLTIWALNTLFPVLAIEYSFWSWLSIIILGGFLRAKVSVNKT